MPDNHRLGDVNQGWTVALTTLMNERASIGAGGGGGGMGLGQRHPPGRDGAATSASTTTRSSARQLMDVYINFQVAKYNNQRAMDKIKAGQLPGPEMSIAKLSLTNNMWRTANFVADVLGPRIIADTGEWGTYSWRQLAARRARHAGRRRHRRGHAEHRRRAGARPAQGPRHRLQDPLQGPARQLARTAQSKSRRARGRAPARWVDAGHARPRQLSMNTQDRRWIAVGPMPCSAILCRGHG